jgi:uncharacterized protein YndB with AHSA1/START domain
MKGDVARVSVFVRVPPAEAFRVFTEEIDAWWRSGPRFRVMGREPGRLRLHEGKLTETVILASGREKVFEVGRAVVWEPPTRLVLEWRLVNFAPSEKTLVEVLFSASGEGTMVRLSHSGWAAIRADHPARHGESEAAFLRTMGLWWGELATSLREHIEARASLQ